MSTRTTSTPGSFCDLSWHGCRVHRAPDPPGRPDPGPPQPHPLPLAAPDPGRQALPTLAHLRNGYTYTRPAEGSTVGVATVFRYIREATDLLAAYAPSLSAALWRLAHNGHHLGILDGTVVRIDRLGGDLNRLHPLRQPPPPRRQPAGPGRPPPR